MQKIGPHFAITLSYNNNVSLVEVHPHINSIFSNLNFKSSESDENSMNCDSSQLENVVLRKTRLKFSLVKNISFSILKAV